MLNANRAGNALGLTFAAIFSLCSLLYVVWPQGFMSATAMVFHGFQLSAAPHAMSFAGFVFGAICIAIMGYIIGAIYATIWNALSAERATVQVSRPAPR